MIIFVFGLKTIYIYIVLALKNIDVNFIFFARLYLYLQFSTNI